MEKELELHFETEKQNEKKLVDKVLEMRFTEMLTFKQISEKLKIEKSKVIHYCTDLKYRNLK